MNSRRQVKAHARDIAEFDSRERQQAKASPNALRAIKIVNEACWRVRRALGAYHPESMGAVEVSDWLLDLIDRGEDIPAYQADGIVEYWTKQPTANGGA